MDVQVVEHGYKYEKYKRFYKQHQVHGHVDYDTLKDTGCIWWIILIFIFGLLVTCVVLYWTVPPAAHLQQLQQEQLSPPAYRRMQLLRERNKRLLPLAEHHYTAKRVNNCKTGETFDTELQMCAPNFKSPLAFDGSIMDPSRPACDSFYHNMCGRWIQQHTNENRAFSYGYRKNMARVHKLVTTAPAATSPIGKFYASCLALESQHSKRESIITLKHTMERVLGDLRSHGDLPTVFGRLARLGYTAPFALSIERHPTEPRMLPLLVFDSFPTELDESRIYQIMNHYRDVTNYNILETQQRITALLKIMRAMRIQNTAEQSIEEIGDIADYVVNRFPSDLVRFESLRDWNLKGYGPVRGWNLFFQALDGQSLRFHHDQQVWVIGRNYMHWLLSTGIASFEVNEWRAFIEFSIIYNGVQFEPDLPNDVYFRQHGERGPLGAGGRLYHRVPRGPNSTHILTPQERCVRTTHAMIPGLVAHAFLDTYFGQNREAMRQDVRKLVDHIKQALMDRVAATSWLTQEDKAIMQAKLQATLVRVAEPDEWEVEPFAPRIEADRYDHNMNLVRMYRVQRNLGLWHKDLPNSLDRNAVAFFALPLTDTNAYYSGSTNTITILAGLLQPPFYDTGYGQLSKFAILGSIIGHELSHMFDVNGLFWSKDGSFVPNGILSPAGMSTLFNQTDCVVEDFADAPGGCEDVNVAYGNTTLAEDMADLTGIALSYEAYFNYTDAGRAAPLGDKQHFYMSEQIRFVFFCVI